MATTSHGAENEVIPAVACPYLSLSAAHIFWYKLVREMPCIGPLKALNTRPAYSLSMTATVNQARS